MPDDVPLRPFKFRPGSCVTCGNQMRVRPSGSRVCDACGSTVDAPPDLSDRPKTSWSEIKKT